MKKILLYLKATITGGILLLVPLLVLALAIIKIVQLLRRAVVPIAHHFPIPDLGIGKDTLLSILLLLLLSFCAGLFMYTRLARQFKQILEDQILVHVPGYTYLKALSTDKLLQNPNSTWKPAVLQGEGQGSICFVVEESEHFYSLFLPSSPSPSSGSVCVRNKNEVILLKATFSETVIMLKQLGKGAAAMLEK